MRRRRWRRVAEMLGIALGAVLGAVAAYLLGYAMVVSSAEAELARHAERLGQRGEQVVGEARKVLRQVNASALGYCSDPEIQLLRDLAFRSQFFKDVGRVRDGEFHCSAVLGRLPKPFRSAAPDLVTPDGLRVYGATPLLLGSNARATIFEFGNGNVVVNPNVFEGFSQPPMRYEISIANPATQQMVRAFGDEFVLPSGAAFVGGAARLGNTLFYVRCSSDALLCAITSAPMSALRRSSLPQLVGYAVLGAVAGGSLGTSGIMYWRRNQSVPRQLRRAIRNDALSLVYQPLVDLRDRRMVGAEALVRWTDQSGNTIPPDVFVGIAEAGGFVTAITRLVVRKAVDELKPALARQPGFRLAINIAADDLADAGFPVLLRETIEAAGIRPQSITLELTERSTADHAVVLAGIARLRQLGLHIDIDDFGTGYSSLAYLNQLEIDAIKIDRSFTATIGTDAVTASIVPQILAMAETLKLGVVVEGIETEAQAAYFAALGRPILGQGWLFGKPVPAAALLDSLTQAAAGPRSPA